MFIKYAVCFIQKMLPFFVPIVLCEAPRKVLILFYKYHMFLIKLRRHICSVCLKVHDIPYNATDLGI